MAAPRVLLTSAVGYIGGLVLTDILATKEDKGYNFKVSAQVRRQDQANALKTYGVTPIMFKDLDDSETITWAAIFIQTANGYHPGSAKALVIGLGTSNLRDYPTTGTYAKSGIFSDKDVLYSYEKVREELVRYGQRCSRHFNRLSIQTPAMIRAAAGSGQAEMIGEGKERWDHVHVLDLVELYTSVLGKVVAAENIPNGKEGIYLRGQENIYGSKFPRGLRKQGFTLVYLSRTRADMSREIGWNTTKTETDWNGTFQEEFALIIK
ncbi:hypothetical protein P154DRAFT_548730 [Amniculicola lignicola CBS 123094]|uniref:NAD-dependent epimerase/dehydratase domain-containing protein n=1 Tax=Amniculicola lignicola CBS 123094 TaxID=1392246 RepID=A0A6A5W4L4_9PLEO|nr:hypothetical protein P154DRAFT_548730 [Amniculicola lignicola CBS 123094]